MGKFKDIYMEYKGEELHGYWWLHYNGQLRYNKSTLHGIESAEKFYKYAPCVKWWHVTCEFHWYKMLKEFDELREGVPNSTA